MADTQVRHSPEELASAVHLLPQEDRESFERFLDEMDGFKVNEADLAESRRELAEGRWITIDQLKAELSSL